ncbi:bifunctional 4-hydroxy-2-oxoglutarate aldolase/2-dehydro-3-deoxy-phosphogluconate aldolase [Vibrio nigripulchritudo]|uniref:bifunctional 4-hydroxy-2-oxoglutarate aldolase/2-dehydro-3-deoxy-phosphogluconate aldolase n=1 Tax=Vibrio nigripulchritudo TaxID=28173 RepID=UPI0003B1A157|nr:bifunctional 4-hydroxy-2-oxoglutarate aldolase/2-dehydro-3-deoxy-phosphogluconate aldolase [Vibrio nigripulchritudo]CCN68711.1 2-dehydro-3-deoxyphosphogluconate aldolase [Vibrio nigripulchritudo SFn118]
MSQDVFQTLAQHKVVPVISITSLEQAEPLANALMDNGLPVAEITFRTEMAAEAIAIMVKAQPELCVGAGTLIKPEQVDAAIAAGAKFGVAPGFNPTVTNYCKSKDFAFIPGVNSPSQIEITLESGFSLLKFFPAEASGGIPMLKALLAPYGDVSFMPTGGVNIGNVKDYLSIDRVVCCGGTWLASTDLMEQGKWDEIGNRIRAAVSSVSG